MKIDVLRVVTRGAAPGERPCEGCWEKGRQLRECRIPWSTHTLSDCFWRDLCGGCSEKLKQARRLPVGPEPARRAWEKALQLLQTKQ